MVTTGGEFDYAEFGQLADPGLARLNHALSRRPAGQAALAAALIAIQQDGARLTAVPIPDLARIDFRQDLPL